MKKIITGLFLIALITGCSKSAEELVDQGTDVIASEAKLEWDGSLYDFQETDLGDDKLRTMVLKNVGEGKSKPIVLNWTDKTQTSWKIVPGQDQCTNKVLNPGEVCSVTVMFSPVKTSTESNALMASDGSKETAMAVRGRGISSVDSSSEEILEIEKEVIVFETLSLGREVSKVISIKNGGSDIIAGVSASLVSENFKVENYSCQGKTLRPNQSCSVKVVFSPNSIGEHMAEVVISGATTSKNVILQGSSTASRANLVVSPNPLNLEVERGTPSLERFTVTNSGQGPSRKLSVSFENGMNFQLINNNCGRSIGAGETCTFSVKNLALWTNFQDKMTLKGGKNDVEVLINVVPKNTTGVPNVVSPMAMDYSYETEEEVPVFDAFRASDATDTNLTYEIVSSPSKGSVVIEGSTFTYTPAKDKVGEDSFTFKATNSSGNSSEPKTISILINNKEDEPEVQSYMVDLNENESTTFNLNETYVYDPEGGYLFITRVGQPSHGSIRLNPNNTLTYTPDDDYEGPDSFIYYVSNGIGERQGTLNLTVNRVNEIPTTENVLATTDEDVSTSINLVGNDLDGDTLTYQIVSAPSNGILSGTAPNLTYTPNANYNGTDSFTYRVNDGQADSNISTVDITVNPVNDLPVAQTLAYNTNEDVPVNTVLVATDVEGDSLTYQVVSGPANGVLSGTIPNLTYTPNSNYNGVDSFTYRANDGQGNSNVATVSVNVSATNDSPIADSKTITTDEDVPVAVGLTGSDLDGDTLTYQIVSGPSNGTLSGTLPNLIYTPNANYNGNDNFTYRVNDGQVNSNLATVAITVNPVNDAPTISDQNISVDEDTPKNFSLTATDIDGDTLTWEVVSTTSNGSLTINGPGSFTYNPNTNYNGLDTFTVRVNDGTVNSNTATIALNVGAENDLPVMADQTLNVNEDESLNIDITGTDADGDVLTYTVVSGPTNGVLSGTEPNLIYTPNSNYNGPESIQVRANDGTGNSNISTISITVNPVNDAPIAQDDTVNTTEDTPVSVNLVGTDVDGDSLTYYVVAGPSNGTLSGTLPNLTYTPNSNYNGVDSFTFRVNDGSIDSNTATITLNVSATNDLPVASDLNLVLDEDTSGAVNLVATDNDGDTLTYEIVAAPTNGTLSGTAPNLNYTPNSNYNGSDSFTYRVNDGTGNSNISTVAITVNPVNDTPVADNNSISTLEDTPVAVVLTGSDIDGDALTYQVVSGPTNGTLSGTVPNLTYTPNVNYNGSDSFTFRVNDGTVNSNVATISINVNADNDAPVADNKVLSTDEDTPAAVVLTGSDDDGDALIYTVVSGPTNGVLSGTLPNLTYTPNANYNGSDSFTYQVNDGTVNSNVATVAITVNPVNDAPVALDNTVAVVEDNPLSVVLVGTDVDGDTLTYQVVSGPTNGVLSGTVPNLTYTPNANYNGSDSFTYQVNDGTLDSNTATVVINVSADNDAPVISDISVVMDEDTSEAITLTGTDSDGDILNFQVMTGPSNGVLSGTIPNLTYTPNTNYNGVDSFTYRANDGQSNSTVQTVSLTINPVDDPTVAHDKTLTVDEDTAGTVTLTLDEVDGDSLTWTIVSGPTNGSLSGTIPNVTYTPDANYHGSDSFTYKVNDGTSDSNTATVSITIDSINDAPIAGNAGTPGTEDTPKNIGSFLSGLASDPDGDPLTWTITVPPSHGTLSGTLPNVIYTPDPNYTGPDEFRYKVNDGQLDSDTVFGGRISIFMSAVNDRPVWTTSTTINLTTQEDTQVQTTVNATDVESSVSYSVGSCPNGTCAITSGGLLTYTPSSGFSGNTTVSLECSDGSLYCSPSTTINITVEANEPAPRDNSILITIDHDEVEENLTDFPVMYNLQSLGDHFWNNVQSDGGDIAVTSEDQSVRYSLELTNFNKANKTGLLFIKMDVSSTVDTSFNIKYNDTATASVSLPARNAAFGSEDVWSNGYAGVWHLDESGNAQDSTSNLNHLTSRGGTSYNEETAKHLEDSMLFNGDVGHDDMQNRTDTTGSSLDLTTAITMEAWVNPQSFTTDQRVMHKRDGVYHSLYGLLIDNGRTQMRIHDDSGSYTEVTGDTNLRQNEWNYVAATFHDSSNNGKVFLNGEVDKNQSVTHEPDISNDLFEIGGIEGRGDRGFNGHIDEVRLSNVVRSTGWIKTNYTMTNSPSLFFKEKNSTLVASDQFSDIDSYSTPSGWNYMENNSTDVQTYGGSLWMQGDNSSTNPGASKSFTGQSSGMVEVSFDFYAHNNGSEMYHDFMMQVGESSLMSFSNMYTDGIGANLKWASVDHGMSTANGFGYYLSPITTQVATVNNEWVSVVIRIDMDNQQYNFIVKGQESGWVSFEDMSVNTINKIRFFTNEADSSNTYNRIDNVVIRRLP